MKKLSFVKQTETNSGGGVRLSVYKQTYDDVGALIHEEPHRITVDIDDDFDAIIAMNNEALGKMGYPAIDPIELDLPKTIRAASHAHPAVQERMSIERAERLKQRKRDEKQRLDAALAEQQAETAKAARVQKMIDDAVAKALGKS